MNPDSDLLTTVEAAAFLRSNPRTLERWRVVGIGPRFAKIGHRVAYSRVSLSEWVQRQSRQSTSEAV